ncbi:MAG: hypothetical protein KBC38_01125 [Candidatus Pacebacteria bacterium]|nr:hypothetical protein [Candidatus Paceibacterota bacterium]MBP9840236.1 hypothetical protein [Candidatus Paceibacterota bacterium]
MQEYSFITIPRSYADDYRERRISKPERQMLEWLRQLGNPYSMAIVDLTSLAEDSLPQGATANYANKILLSLKCKKYIYYRPRAGCRGSFQVYLDWWPAIGKDNNGRPRPPRRITHYFEAEQVRGESTPETVTTAEAIPELESGSQRSKSLDGGLYALQKNHSITETFRAPNTDTYTKKKIDIRAIDSPKRSRNLSVERFLPETSEEERCWEIAQELGETKMDFLIGSVHKYGIDVIEEALERFRASSAFEEVENPAAYFNSVLQNLVRERDDQVF